LYRWKDHINSLVENNLANTSGDLMKLVYGAPAGMNSRDSEAEKEQSSDDDDIFQPIDDTAAEEDTLEQLPDASKFAPEAQELDNWEDHETREVIRNRFVTGDWGKAERAKKKKEQQEEGAGADEDGNEEGSDDEVYGDFEDLETGEKFDGKPGEEGDSGGDNEDEDDDEDEDEEMTAEERRRKKAALKSQFDRDYDGGKGKDDPAEGGGRKEKQGEDNENDYANIEGLRAVAVSTAPCRCSWHMQLQQHPCVLC
jgi:ribosome biogenesis protein BMS1